MLAVVAQRHVGCFVAVWLAAVVLGFAPVIVHSSTPGRAAQAPPVLWPQQTALEFVQGRFHLVLFLHPHCPCTRATIEELARLRAQWGQPLQVDAVFIRPQPAPAGWEVTDTYRAASRIPGVRVLPDPGAVETRRFGAETSGQTYLYAPEGALVFRGGITPARGHSGANVGSEAILRALRGGNDMPAEAPVFGCSLFPPGNEASP